MEVWVSALRLDLSIVLLKELLSDGPGFTRVRRFLDRLKEIEDVIGKTASIYDATWTTALDKDLEAMASSGVGEVATWLSAECSNGPPFVLANIQRAPPVAADDFAYVMKAFDEVNGIVATHVNVNTSIYSGEGGRYAAGSTSQAIGKRSRSTPSQPIDARRFTPTQHEMGLDRSQGLANNGCKAFWGKGFCGEYNLTS